MGRAVGARTYSARVMRFRQGVYRSRTLNAGTKVLLLRLSESMNQNCIVSVPREQLAAEFHCDKARVSEWVKQAKDQNYLSVVKPAKRGRTAVYQGMNGVRPAAPHSDEQTSEQGAELRTPSRYAKPHPIDGEWGALCTPPTEVVQTAAIGADHNNHLEQRGQDEKSA